MASTNLLGLGIYDSSDDEPQVPQVTGPVQVDNASDEQEQLQDLSKELSLLQLYQIWSQLALPPIVPWNDVYLGI